MRHFMFVSHGELAKGFVSMIEIIMGKMNNLSYFCGYLPGDDSTVQEAVADNLKSLASNDELIILTDLMGGSVNTESMNFIADSRVHVITGTNASLLLVLLTASPEEPTRELIERAVEESRRGIVYCNSLISEDQSEIDSF